MAAVVLTFNGHRLTAPTSGKFICSAASYEGNRASSLSLQSGDGTVVDRETKSSTAPANNV